MTTRSLTSADVTVAAIRNTSSRLPLDRAAPSRLSKVRATLVARPCLREAVLAQGVPKSIEPIRKGRIVWPYRAATYSRSASSA